MICDPEKHHRRSIRLKGYDYAQPGAYFVTICTRNWVRLFGEVAAGSIVLNPMGQVVEEEWLRTAEIRPNVELDAFVIMPNHVHGIVMIIDHGRGVLPYAPTRLIIKCGGAPVSRPYQLPTVWLGNCYRSSSIFRVSGLPSSTHRVTKYTPDASRRPAASTGRKG